ncbi:MAG TPA: polyprenyl synthetase family protein [Pseudonocardiaceae bacterium]|jgi:geranylgeranyl diphosphate synthase type I|nr:polyprenyl synthetase family protein [Pseudonocardiaceae bacterium]
MTAVMVPGPTDENLPKQVEAILADHFATRRADIEAIGADFAEAVDALAGFVLGGGKRIRPTFAWWGWRGAGGDPDSADAGAVLTALSALELVQAGALLHDDLMDASAVRRGAPTMHVTFARRHREQDWLGDPERFGLATALLLGDVALAWADDLFHGAGLPARTLAAALGPWRAMRAEVLGGQYVDVLTQARGDSSIEAALRVDRFKTAAYTVERPLHLGAALGGGGPELVDAFRRFGADVGIAFQLRDDLLGVFGDPEVTGKPAGDDLREGKRTLLMALGLNLADMAGRPADAALLRSCLGRADLAEAEVDTVRAVLIGVGAVAAVEQRISALTEAGLAALRAGPVPEPVRGQLAELAISATDRDR